MTFHRKKSRQTEPNKINIFNTCRWLFQSIDGLDVVLRRLQHYPSYVTVIEQYSMCSKSCVSPLFDMDQKESCQITVPRKPPLRPVRLKPGSFQNFTTR